MLGNYPYRTGARMLMIPVALVIGFIVGLLWLWDAGLLIGVLLFWLAPGIFTIFFKRLRRPLLDEEKQKKENKELEKTSKWYYYLFHEGESRSNDDTGFIPMN